jgi:hypothetical protein
MAKISSSHLSKLRRYLAYIWRRQTIFFRCVVECYRCKKSHCQLRWIGAFMIMIYFFTTDVWGSKCPYRPSSFPHLWQFTRSFFFDSDKDRNTLFWIVTINFRTFALGEIDRELSWNIYVQWTILRDYSLLPLECILFLRNVLLANVQ